MMCKRLLLLVIFAATAAGGTHRIPPDEPVATIRLPDRWQVSVQGEITQALSPNDHVHFLIVPIERHKAAEAMGEVMGYIRNGGSISVDDTTRRVEKTQVNGREAQQIWWEGNQRGESLEIHFIIFFATPDQPWLAAWWGSSTAIKRRQPELDKAVQSVKATEKERD